MIALTFDHVINHLRSQMAQHGRPVHTERWQGRDIASNPAAQMFELLHVHVKCPMSGPHIADPMSLEHWRQDIKPNLPWTDAHFAERVSGVPMNPGTEWANWPWGRSADGFRRQAQFNHNYMERYWPKYAGAVQRPTHSATDWRHGMNERTESPDANRGIRHAYGDLMDVVMLLEREPMTRQAYLPIFFPEDTGYGDGDRKPCTLGYHFMVRDGGLDVFYPMRSCDLVRHFQDDLYLTVRLVIWMIETLRLRNGGGTAREWDNIKPGRFVMQISNLHCFVNDHIGLRREHDARIAKALS